MKYVVFLSCLVVLGLSLSGRGEVTAAQLWQEYTKSPNTHPTIPNCSYAGYAYGEKALPSPKVVANVRDCGAKGDGVTDDSAAFADAIKKAGDAGGGAVLIPAGTYSLSEVVRVHANAVVLRGEGPGKTILVFARPLQDALGRFTFKNLTQFSWTGGMVWFAPKDMFTDQGKLASTKWEEWEQWKLGAKVGDLADAARGETTVRVSENAGSLKAGQMIAIAQTVDADYTMLDEIGGHPLMKEWDWKRATWMKLGPYIWPVEVVKVAGNAVTLKQPLRLPLKGAWKPVLYVLGDVVRESGIEELTIQLPKAGLARHNVYAGYNGLCFSRALNCFVRNVDVENVDNGLFHVACKNNTVTGLRITGRDNHHATAMRVMSADNLIENFTIESKPLHGINVEWLASGNVWRNGTMKHGTFDSHGGLSFDDIRTRITINNDGAPGGDKAAGPFLGARVVNWNIEITNNNGDYINQPEQYSMGALVGIRGAALVPGVGFNMAKGDKGTRVADEGKTPAIEDLYAAQLKLRLGK